MVKNYFNTFYNYPWDLDFDLEVTLLFIMKLHYNSVSFKNCRCNRLTIFRKVSIIIDIITELFFYIFYFANELYIFNTISFPSWKYSTRTKYFINMTRKILARIPWEQPS